MSREKIDCPFCENPDVQKRGNGYFCANCEHIIDASQIRRLETVMVKFLFTDEEKIKLAEKQSSETIRAGKLAAELDIIKRDYKGRIEGAEHQSMQCALKISAGFELRDTQCYVERDFKGHTIRFINPDTGEILEERPMSIDERQMNMIN